MINISFIFALFFFLISRLAISYILSSRNTFVQGDVINHLQFLKRIWKNKGKIPTKIDPYILDDNDYPNGFHKLCYLTRLPISFFEKYGGYLPPLFDLLLMCMIYTSMHIWGGEFHYWILAFPFLRLPIIHEGRAGQFSERAFGVLITNGFLLSSIIFATTHSTLALIPAILTFSILACSSKFAWQAATFFPLLLTCLTGSLDFLFVYAISFVSAIILTKGYAWRVLKGLIRHSYFYSTYYKKRYLAFGCNHYKELFNLFRSPNRKNLREFVLNNAIGKLFFEVPIHLLIFYIWFQNGVVSIFDQWAISGVLLTLLIATNPLRFLGEPERYLEYSLIPLFIILSYYDFAAFNGLAYFVLILLLALAVYHARSIYNNYLTPISSAPDAKRVVDFFSSSKEKTILTVPLRLSFLLGYHNDRNKYLSLFSNVGKEEQMEAYKELVPDVYPFPGSDLHSYIQRYGIDYIICDKAQVDYLEKMLARSYYDFSSFKTCFETKHFTVFTT